MGGVLAVVTVMAAAGFAQEVLPRPDQPFKGKIGRTVKESKPDFPKEVQAPKGAPNILLIMTDDVGFGASSPFGGPIATPTLDRLAQNGLRFNQFHTTALDCAVLADALGAHNGAQSPHQCHRRDHGDGYGLPGL